MRNLKKVIALVAVFAMLVSTVAFAQTFTDVAEDHDYYEAIEMLSSLQILTGDDQDGDGKLDFRPEDTITRAEVAAVISRIQAVASVAQRDTEFVDVPASHWASGYVAQAAGQGIVNGYGDGNFGPEDPVLYEQAVKMLVETLGYAPFVNDNGGYPTGHLTAASRYGILDGVSGGSIGAQATRGMVAQMVYNAIDTPVMDRYTYGSEAEYIIYNGKNGNDYVTLLSRELGVKKFSGVITQNQVTDFTSAQAIDTEDEVEIEVIYDGYDYDNDTILANTDYANYDCDEIDTIYEADSNAGALLGYHVEMYVQETGRTGYYNVLSVATTNKNKVTEFTLDQYDSYADDVINYYKNASDRKTTEAKLEDDAVVIYNNVAYNFASDEDLADLLDGNETWSGKVTLVDNDAVKGADVVFVEIGAVAVIDEVAATGKVSFKNDVVNSVGDTLANLYFDEEDTETVIVLNKDGKAIEFTELQEWDVLSVLFTDNNEDYVVANVVEGGKVEGSITGSTSSETSADGSKYTINNTQYDLAEGYYNNNGTIAVGASGVFYVDNYGKIVAYDKNGTTTASDKYAYVLKAVAGEVGSWEEMTVKVLLLDKSGEIYEAQLADKVKFTNADTTDVWYKPTGSVEIEKIEDDLDDLADELQGSLITYDSNSAGEVDEIGFALVGDYEGEGEFFQAANHTNSSYDEEDRELKVGGQTYELADDTIVFYINGTTGAVGFGDEASKTTSKVGTAASVATTNSVSAAVYDTDNDVPAVIVLFNTTGGISPATSAAVIDEVGTAYVDGDDVISVTYFQNGEKLSATTDPELTELGDAKLEDATQGDIWKLSVVDGVIIEAVEFVDFKGRTGAFDSALSKLTFEAGSYVAGKTFADDASVAFGAAVDYKKTTKKIVLSDLAEEATLTEVKANNANVYVYDEALKKNKIKVGAVSDVNTDEDLYAAHGGITIKNGNKTDVAANIMPTGMFDYVAAVYNEDDVIDIVVYKAYDFKYVVKDVVVAPAE